MNKEELEKLLRKDRKYTKYKNSIEFYVNLQDALELTDEELIHYMYKDLDIVLPEGSSYNRPIIMEYLSQYNCTITKWYHSDYDYEDYYKVYESKDGKIKLVYYYNYMTGMGSDWFITKVK